MVEGSAVKLLMVGLPIAGGGSVRATGGGGAAATFFLQAAANTNDASASSTAPILKKLIFWKACSLLLWLISLETLLSLLERFNGLIYSTRAFRYFPAL